MLFRSVEEWEEELDQQYPIFISEMEMMEEIEGVISGIDDKKPMIVYIGVGSNFTGYSGNMERVEEWEEELDQQYPIFISEMKRRNKEVGVKIILIDPGMEEVPYIIRNRRTYLYNTFERVGENRYYSTEYDVEVYIYREMITWDNSISVYREGYDMTERLSKMVEMMERKNGVLIYHEYVGRNVIELRRIIKMKIGRYDEGKVCIDITMGGICHLKQPLIEPTGLKPRPDACFSNDTLLPTRSVRDSPCFQFTTYLTDNSIFIRPGLSNDIFKQQKRHKIGPAPVWPELFKQIIQF